jgi:hypothetical protein
MSPHEHENDPDETHENAAERPAASNIDSSEESSPGPWAKTSAGDDADDEA